MIFLLLLAFSLLIYLPTLNTQPTYDDTQYFIDASLKEWNWGWIWSWSSRSLTEATIRATFAFVPPFYQIQAFHLTNIVLHFLNACLLYGIVGTRDPAIAPVAALLFAVSPLATSAVTMVSTRSLLLSTSFIFGVIGLGLQGHWILALALVIPAIWAREDAVTVIPFLIWISPARVGWVIGGMLIVGARWYLPRVLKALSHKLAQNGDKGMAAAGMDVSFPQPYYTLTSINENLWRWLFWQCGLFQNPDPTIRPTPWKSLRLWGAVLVLLIMGAGILILPHGSLPQLILLLIACSPWTASWLIQMPDPVVEARAYSTIAGFAILVSRLPLPIEAWGILIKGFALMALYRTYQRRDAVNYWKAAHRPGQSKLRVILNIGASYQMLSDMQNALHWHQQALELNSTNGIVLANVGLWHEGMARMARLEFLNDLIMTGVANAEKAKECTLRSNQHLAQALNLMSLGIYYCPDDPMVQEYTKRVRAHAAGIGLIPQ